MMKAPQTMTQRTPPHKDIAETFSAASEIQNTSAAPQTSTQTHAPPPSLGVDTAYYQRFLDDYDIPDAQKRELIEALWAIIVQFIDLGFGVHPITTAQDRQQSDETLHALKAVARDYALEAFEHGSAADPVLVEDLVIADNARSAPSNTQSDTQTERRET